MAFLRQCLNELRQRDEARELSRIASSPKRLFHEDIGATSDRAASHEWALHALLEAGAPLPAGGGTAAPSLQVRPPTAREQGGVAGGVGAGRRRLDQPRSRGLLPGAAGA